MIGIESPLQSREPPSSVHWHPPRTRAHGAGRRLSRLEARRRLSAKDVKRELRGVWFDHRLASGLREEAPSAYKDMDGVLRAQRDLVSIVRRLRPVLGFKGG